ncbi:MAG: NAD-binding protein [Peptostreptococcaceae bacterium]|nr:NAD-binding protein [Peptostreptococcaceae bacterium]
MKIIIIGAGKLGTKLATSMLSNNMHVAIMDSNPVVLGKLKDHMDVLTINANGARKEILEKLNISSYDLAIAVTSNDETNILISSMAKKLGCKKNIRHRPCGKPRPCNRQRDTQVSDGKLYILLRQLRNGKGLSCQLQY